MLKHANKNKFVLIIAVSVVIILVISVFQFSLIFSESVNFKKYSLSYVTLLSSEIKKFLFMSLSTVQFPIVTAWVMGQLIRHIR